MDAKHYDQASALYSQILQSDPSNVSAWEGLISARHEIERDTEAIADVEKMPTAAYETALADPAFLAMLGAIYQQANQFEVAQGLLERSYETSDRSRRPAERPTAVAVGGHLSSPQQHRSGIRHLSRVARGPSRPCRRMEGHDCHADCHASRSGKPFRRSRRFPRLSASSSKRTSTFCKLRPASTPPRATPRTRCST